MERMNTSLTSINEYLKPLPTDVRAALQALRETIQSAAPKAEEVISYGMPAFKHKGVLVYFAAFKNHCSLFPGNSSLIKKLNDELKPFKTSKGTIQFTVDKPLPARVVKRIVKLRVAENEERAAIKELKNTALKTHAKKKPTKSKTKF